MKLEERKVISKGLYDIIAQFKYLKEQQIGSLPSWPRLAESLVKSHDFIKNILQIYIDQCECYINQINTDTRDKEIWKMQLDHLWMRIEYLRRIVNNFFYFDYNNIIYQQIFFDELIETLSNNSIGDISFFLVPVGEVFVFYLSDYDLPSFFDSVFLNKYDDLRNNDKIICFGCHHTLHLEHQTVLTHEIFHTIVKKYPNISIGLDKISSNSINDILFTPQVVIDKRSQIEEYFCDFAAAWYFGPVFLQSFADELSYFKNEPSETHPPSDFRAKFLLNNFDRYKSHHGWKKLKEYFEYIKTPQDQYNNQKEIFKNIGNSFSEMLINETFKQYSYDEDQHHKYKEIIEKHFNKNIPFVVNDIRDFINNIPDKPHDMSTKKYNDLLAESLRKINILRQVKNQVRDPSELFALPKSLSK